MLQLLALRKFSVILAAFVILLPLVSRAQATADSHADETALRHTTLSMDAVTRMYQTTADLKTLEKAHPEWTETQEDSDKDKSDESIEASVRKLSAHPEVVALVNKHGFTPREYIVTGLALMTAAFAEATATQNKMDPSQLADQANINPANVAFVAQHKTELEVLQKKTTPPPE